MQRRPHTLGVDAKHRQFLRLCTGNQPSDGAALRFALHKMFVNEVYRSSQLHDMGGGIRVHCPVRFGMRWGIFPFRSGICVARFQPQVRQAATAMFTYIPLTVTLQVLVLVLEPARVAPVEPAYGTPFRESERMSRQYNCPHHGCAGG